MERFVFAALSVICVGWFAGPAFADCPDPAADASARALGNMVGVVGAAVRASKGCLPAHHPDRAKAEARERAQIEADYTTWMRDACTTKKCVGNQWAALVDATDYEYAARELLAGCGRWAALGSSFVAQKSKPRYWSVREVKFGEVWHGYELLHWVVELRNERTGETFYLDGWNAAKKARPTQVIRADPQKMKDANAVRGYAELYGQWGEVTGELPCVAPHHLCNPGSCGRKP